MSPSHDQPLDVVVIGAGPAGVGLGLALQAVESLSFLVLDRGRIGETFRRWPPALRFLTPSFCGNAFGAPDLNAVHPETSPAFSLGVDYPCGGEYATYLSSVAAHYRLPVREHCEVLAISSVDEGFALATGGGTLHARHVVWAGGEFQAPRRGVDLPGHEHCLHVADGDAWTPGGEAVVIGGFESGIDIACTLARGGTDVVVLDPDEPWRQSASDPSLVLAPRTRGRLREALATGRVQLHPTSALTIDVDGDRYLVRAADGTTLPTGRMPILATGFGPGLGPARPLFDLREDGWPLLTDDDESTRAPGLFLAGPSVRHDDLRLCFVYKFRQRLAHVAAVIARRLGRDPQPLEAWRSAGMLLDDLSCCDAECAC